MVIKYEGKEYSISQHMWDAMNADAIKRGMTIDDYIAEAFTMLRERDAKHK